MIKMESLLIILRLFRQYKLGPLLQHCCCNHRPGPARPGPARPGQGPAVTSNRPT